MKGIARKSRARVNSERMASRALQRLPGGVNSNVRLDAPPIFFSHGRGPWLWDVDGNDYIDYLLGQGPAFLGHAPAPVLNGVEEASRNGMVFGSRHPLEIDGAELLCELVGWPDMVRFGSTGTEMIQTALRAARAATGRRKFVRFEGHYHGWLDNVLIAVGDDEPVAASEGQVADYLRDSFLLPWNDLARVESLFADRAHEIAAVVMEPMMCNAGAILPRPGYLQGVRDLCHALGIVLIYDEVITGFRLSTGGAAQRFGVTPDLAVYGKAMAGGWPVAALAGPANLLEPLGSGRVNHSGTFNANTMAMAATIATLRLLRDEPPYERIERVGKLLMDGLTDIGHGHGDELHIQGLPVAFHASFGEGSEVWDYRGLGARDAQRYRKFAAAVIEEGVWVASRGIWYVSAAHGEREVQETLTRVERAFAGF